MYKLELTQELIRSLFAYKNGNLYWKVSLNSRIKIGSKAGTLNKSCGYYQIGINRKMYYTHRLIFLYHHDYLSEFIDHIDGNKSNNNIGNLRESTRSQNGMNQKSAKNSSSKYKGVHWDKNAKKWLSQIRINGKGKYLGLFINETDAAKSYNKAAIKYYKECANLNEV